MSKPYILTKPADIAMQYGNDKKKIAQAAQLGVVDPTAAVLAGMFIDQVVAQAQAAQTNDLTVAEETFPQIAGLGATPQMAMAPQMPQQMPTEAGVAALPVPEDMVADEYAGGGIVAFQGGGMPIDYTQFGELGEELKRQEELRRLFLGENEALKAEREGMKSAKDEQRAMRLIEAGLGIAGGTSANALENIAKGALPAVKGYGEDVAAQRKRQTELAGMERAERAKVLESAMGTSMAREKLTPETIRAAREIQEEARQNKKPVPSLAEAIKSIERTSGTATLQSAFVNARTNAAKAVGELVNSMTFKQEVKAIEKKQGREAAEAYKRQKIRETVGLFPGVNIDEVMSVVGGSGASAAPSKSSGTVDKNNPLLR
jgi:hypothetical protein